MEQRSQEEEEPEKAAEGQVPGGLPWTATSSINAIHSHIYYDYVTIGCEMVVVEARIPSEKVCIALVDIVEDVYSDIDESSQPTRQGQIQGLLR